MHLFQSRILYTQKTAEMTLQWEGAHIDNAVNCPITGFNHGPYHTTILTPSLVLNKVNSLCCGYLENGQQCGRLCMNNGILRRHIHVQHGASLAPTISSNATNAEKTACRNALILYARSGDWQQASFVNEPGRECGAMTDICNGLEAWAAIHPDFAARFGISFHRNPTNPTKLKKRSAPPTDDDEAAPEASSKPKKSRKQEGLLGEVKRSLSGTTSATRERCSAHRTEPDILTGWGGSLSIHVIRP